VSACMEIKMAKFEKLLLALNLLHNRPFVTLESIMRECQVCERTAYRYVESLSIANFPVYYDSEVKGYRLSRRGNPITNLSLDEAAVLLYGLALLENTLESQYFSLIKRARMKLETRIPFTTQDLVVSSKQMLASEETPVPVKDQIVMSIIKLSADSEKRVRLEYKSESGTEKIELNHPRLSFDREWKISPSNRDADDSKIPLSSVCNIELV